MQHVIEAQNLTKSYGALKAVDGIDFTVRRGECFGFLGPNGAGKTTTMRMLHLAAPVSGGSLRILDHQINEDADGGAIKRRIGVVPQEDNLDQELSTSENLEVFCRFYGLYGKAARRRCDELLDFVELKDKAHAKVQQLSGGMKRRLLIARGLIGTPEILVLDEPTTGLDPQVRLLLWERINRLKHNHTTIVLSTHYMHEAEQLCDQLVIMDHGKIVERGNPQELIKKHAPSKNLEDVFLRLTGRHLEE